ncbi:hypothetical protein [Streptomyces sp. NPDC002602]|uniref:hypothetical protein n=1 Tax=Streptomyces sp. NPDC002602 TaxID=3364654 RepID=UPI00368E8ACE
MPASVLSAAQIAVTVALVAWTISGFTRLPGRWLRWKMFCRGNFIIVTLTGTTKDGRPEPVSAHSHLPPAPSSLARPSSSRSSTIQSAAAGTTGSTGTAGSCPNGASSAWR